jgi:acetyl esterase/lipase
MSEKLWLDKELPFYRSGEETPMLVPYLVEDCQPTSGVVVLPGGGYMKRADHEGEPVAKWLNSLGISAFVLHYRVAPYQHPSPLLDVQRAIRTIRFKANDWGIDPKRIGVLGFSAGGHLAATAGTHFDEGNLHATDPVERESSRPDLLVLCYPVITFQGPYRHQGSIDYLLGDQPTEADLETLSNEKQVTELTPPTFLWHTADDASVHVENSFLFARALREKEIPFELHVFEQGRHGLGLANEEDQVRDWQSQCARWLKKHNF